MSRSNGPASQSGGWPPAGRPAGAEQEPQTQSRPARQPHLIQPAAPQGQPQQYPYGTDPNYGQGYGGQGYAAPGYGAQGYGAQGYAHYDDVPPTGGQARGDYGQQPGYPPRQAAPQQAPSYAPQFDPYVPNSGFPTQPPRSGWEQPAAQQRPAVYPPEAALSQLDTGRGRGGLGDYAVPPPPADPRARAVEQWPTQPSYPQQAGYPPQYAPDPREPDLGGYHPQAAEAAARGYHASPAEPAFDPKALAFGQEPPFHSQGGLEAAAGQQARHTDPGHGYAVPQGYDAQGYEMQAGGYDQHGESQGGYDERAQAGEGDEYEDEEPESSGGKWLYIAAALVMAVGVGGGLAYGYQKFIRGGMQVAAPVVRGDGAPSKIKPAEPGGKQFANRDSKMMDRLSSGSGSPAAANDGASDSDGGTKRVQTIAIGRDGSMAPPMASPAPPQEAGSKPTVNVPGLTVVDGFGSRAQPRPAPPVTASVSPPAQPIVVSPPAPPAKPVVVAKAAPAGPTAVDAIEAPAAPAKPVKPAATAVAAVPKLPVPKKPSGATGAGYVAVLASVPVSGSSQKDSLRQFVDMQSKYSTALQGRTPDVQEVDLGAKGRYHRLLAGPPGSRDAASGVCSQLKAAGYSGCWVIAY